MFSKALLLAAPAGPRVTMGLDPGIRTGVKVAVVSDTGKVLDTSTVYPHEPKRDWEGSIHTLGRLCATHGVNLIAIGNGTASRETDKLAGDLIKRIQQMAPGTPIEKVVKDKPDHRDALPLFPAGAEPEAQIAPDEVDHPERVGAVPRDA